MTPLIVDMWLVIGGNVVVIEYIQFAVVKENLVHWCLKRAVNGLWKFLIL